MIRQVEPGNNKKDGTDRTCAGEAEARLRNTTLSGIMAAFIALMTAYVCHIPMGANGGYIHFGDSLIYLAAALLPRSYAMAAAAIGGGIADMLTAPMWTGATILIKMMITIPFTNKAKTIVTPRNVAAAVFAYVITGTGYCLAEYVLFGTWTAYMVSMLGNLIQSIVSAVLFIAFGLALDKIHFKSKFHMKGKEKIR